MPLLFIFLHLPALSGYVNMWKSIAGWFRSFKWVYMIYNLFQYRRLKHNLPRLRRLGLHKWYFSPLSSRDFRHLPRPAPAERPIPDDLSELKEHFEREGYAVLSGFYTPETTDRINKEIDRLVQTNKKAFAHRHKLMFAIDHSPFLRKLGQDCRLCRILDNLLGDEAVLFQSINFDYGSEQDTHSDSIHMTTYPEGGLIAIWIALEDIGEDQGPLHYYPGSHRLPYYLNADYGNEGSWLRLGSKGYDAYEAFIRKKIEESGLKQETFLARKGDVLIWHANLFHGGSPHTNPAKTRRSMVMHYFARHAICYHEITQRPALFDPSRLVRAE